MPSSEISSPGSCSPIGSRPVQSGGDGVHRGGVLLLGPFVVLGYRVELLGEALQILRRAGVGLIGARLDRGVGDTDQHADVVAAPWLAHPRDRGLQGLPLLRQLLSRLLQTFGGGAQAARLDLIPDGAQRWLLRMRAKASSIAPV